MLSRVRQHSGSSLWFSGGYHTCDCSITQPCLTFWDPMDCSPPGSSVPGIFFQQEYWSGLSFPPPWDLSNPGIKHLSNTTSPESPILHLDTGKTLTTPAAAKSLQSCPTLCDPIDGSPPGSPIPGILQARTLEWVAISFSNA